MNTPVPVSSARANLPKLVEKVDKNLERVVISVNGRPKVVMISMEELESLEETAEILTLPNIKKDIETSRKQIKKGEFTPLSKLK